MLKLVFVIILMGCSFAVVANAAPIGRFTDIENSDVCALNFAKLGHAAEIAVTAEDRARLTKEISNAVYTLKSLERSSSEITSIAKSHRTGAFTSGAFEVETVRGPKFLKIYADTTVEQSAYTQVLQNALARKGMAPAIYGYLSHSEIQRLMARFPDLRKALEGDPTSFAVLMDRIEPIASVDKGKLQGTLPSTWTKERLKERVGEFEKVMSGLRIIPPLDIQAMIDRDGRFLLFDFDGYGHVTMDQKVFAYESPVGQMSHATFTRSYYGDDITWSKGDLMDRFRLDAKGAFHAELFKLRRILGL